MFVLKNPMLKKYLVLGLITLLGLTLAGCISGLSPQFTYQGLLTNASGQPLNGNVTITYRIFNVETGGTALYSETETVTVNRGQFSSIVGPTSAVAGLSPEDLAQPLWIEIQVNDGTNTETLTPRQRLYGAPYAFTLMPGTVISATMNEEVYGVSGISAIASVVNMQILDGSNTPLPALRVIGDRGIELVDVNSSVGTIYSDLDESSSDLYFYANDNFHIYLDNDHNEAGTFNVYGDTLLDYCRINDLGNFWCTGTKSSVTEVDGETRALYAIESPDVWFEDFGSAKLSGGSATVNVDPQFAQTVNLGVEYHVFLTPLGDCNGLYVASKTADGFEVRELGGGTSDIAFDYRIVAKRLGYEETRLEVVPTDAEGAGQ